MSTIGVTWLRARERGGGKIEHGYLFYGGTAPPVVQGPLIIGASPSHSDTPPSVGLLRTSDQPDAGTST
jgi:hypothetical protein